MSHTVPDANPDSAFASGNVLVKITTQSAINITAPEGSG